MTSVPYKSNLLCSVGRKSFFVFVFVFYQTFKITRFRAVTVILWNQDIFVWFGYQTISISEYQPMPTEYIKCFLILDSYICLHNNISVNWKVEMWAVHEILCIVEAQTPLPNNRLLCQWMLQDHCSVAEPAVWASQLRQRTATTHHWSKRYVSRDCLTSRPPLTLKGGMSSSSPQTESEKLVTGDYNYANTTWG